VKRWRDFRPHGLFPLPHPSPRNQRWFTKNPWFKKEVLEALREEVNDVLSLQP
jgi:uracil-DNA glycosylase